MQRSRNISKYFAIFKKFVLFIIYNKCSFSYLKINIINQTIKLFTFYITTYRMKTGLLKIEIVCRQFCGAFLIAILIIIQLNRPQYQEIRGLCNICTNRQAWGALDSHTSTKSLKKEINAWRSHFKRANQLFKNFTFSSPNYDYSTLYP